MLDRLPNQLVRPQDAVGKTVAKAIGGAALLLIFTDGTFLFASVDSEDDNARLDCTDWLDDWSARDVGLITPEQFAARQAQLLRDRERSERATYERLKAKFEASKQE